MNAHHDIPFLEYLGAKIESWTETETVVYLDIQAQHLNRTGVVHGGIYSVLIDAAGGLAGCYSADPQHPKFAYTLSLTTTFIGKASTGRLRSVAHCRRKGRRVYFSSVEIYCGDQLVTIGEGSFLYQQDMPKLPRNAE